MAFHASSAQEVGTVPVYRFWSDVYGSHHYTISEWERDYINANWPDIWLEEGVAFYAYPEW